MVSDRSYTRITLALDIVKRITDGPLIGYHELAVVKHQIDLFDHIAVDHSPFRSISCNNPQVPCDERNICWKAVDLVKAHTGVKGDVSININKNIPVMGGLAGGSANAATTLLLLDRLWGLGFSKGDLESIGRNLGMDVPFYFTGGTALDPEAVGALTPVATSLNFTFLLVVPRFGVSTKDAYAGIDYTKTGIRRSDTVTMVKALQCGDQNRVIGLIHNDFETTVFARHPALHEIKTALMQYGCRASFLSGSGSTMIGVCDDDRTAERIGTQIGNHSDVERVLVQHTLNDKVDVSVFG